MATFFSLPSPRLPSQIITNERTILLWTEINIYSIRKFMTTPVPFPLIQMARTFLFLYIFTVPFVLLSDESSVLAHCFTIFLLTYGFMGLEVVAIELDNPFGDDPNDFDCLALAHTAFEDIYLFTRDCDGPEWADLLLDRMRQSETSSQVGNHFSGGNINKKKKKGGTKLTTPTTKTSSYQNPGGGLNIV